MELVDRYLDEVQKVHGVYLLRVDDECTDEMKAMIWNSWNSMGHQHKLIIMPKEFEMAFIERYSLYVALMMVRQGMKVTRDEWVKEVYPVSQTYHTYSTPLARKRAAYLKLNDKGEVVKVNHRKEKKAKPFLITLEDMDATDYVVVPE